MSLELQQQRMLILRWLWIGVGAKPDVPSPPQELRASLTRVVSQSSHESQLVKRRSQKGTNRERMFERFTLPFKCPEYPSFASNANMDAVEGVGF